MKTGNLRAQRSEARRRAQSAGTTPKLQIGARIFEARISESVLQVDTFVACGRSLVILGYSTYVWLSARNKCSKAQTESIGKPYAQ